MSVALIGAATGVAVEGIILSTIKYWYATPISPLILVLSPGFFVGPLLAPSANDDYFALVFAVQAAVYAVVALGGWALFRHRKSRLAANQQR